MSFLDDPRWTTRGKDPAADAAAAQTGTRGTVDAVDPRDVFTRGLDLPRGLDREPVSVGDERYDLRGSEVARWRRWGLSRGPD